jgi:hypothetical protein
MIINIKRYFYYYNAVFSLFLFFYSLFINTKVKLLSYNNNLPWLQTNQLLYTSNTIIKYFTSINESGSSRPQKIVSCGPALCLNIEIFLMKLIMGI